MTDYQDALHPNNLPKNRSQDNLPGMSHSQSILNRNWTCWAIFIAVLFYDNSAWKLNIYYKQNYMYKKLLNFIKRKVSLLWNICSKSIFVIFLVDNYRARLSSMFGEDEDYINAVIMPVSLCSFRFVGLYSLYKKIALKELWQKNVLI